MTETYLTHEKEWVRNLAKYYFLDKKYYTTQIRSPQKQKLYTIYRLDKNVWKISWEEYRRTSTRGSRKSTRGYRTTESITVHKFGDLVQFLNQY